MKKYMVICLNDNRRYVMAHLKFFETHEQAVNFCREEIHPARKPSIVPVDSDTSIPYIFRKDVH